MQAPIYIRTDGFQSTCASTRGARIVVAPLWSSRSRVVTTVADDLPVPPTYQPPVTAFLLLD